MSFVKLDNLNDFIQPSTACIKPIEKNAPGVVAKVKDVSLSDCLACSGCITSAESVLVQQQNYEELFRVINDNKTSKTNKQIVVSLSLQSVSSLAYKFNLSVQDAAERIASFFVSLGCHKVYDINIARHLSLVESCREFQQRRDGKLKLPIISSICPGWICYAEKTNGELIIPYLSKVRSPQQIMGSLIKESLRSEQQERDAIYHLTLMPCFDKKLEASREDFTNAGDHTRDVDCVLTPIELEEILSDEGVTLEDFAPRKLDVIATTGTSFDGPLTSHHGSSSGGYAENIMLAEASRLMQTDCDKLRADLQYSSPKNNDFIELNLANGGGGGDLGKFAIINGFRNIQTVVQRLKRRALKYDYIEIMACPSGCINGGAQCKPQPGHETSKCGSETSQLYKSVKPVDVSLIEGVNENALLYEKLHLDESDKKQQLLYTEFHPVPKMQNLTVNW